MKTVIFILMAIIAIKCKSGDARVDLANRKVQEQLEVIKMYLADADADSTFRRINAIIFLTELTNIPSESDGSDIGQLDPTSEDYEKWTNWYSTNKHKLRWDEKNKKVVLSESDNR